MQQATVEPEGQQQLSNVVNIQTQDCILKRMATKLDQTAAKLAGQGDIVMGLSRTYVYTPVCFYSTTWQVASVRYQVSHLLMRALSKPLES